MLNRFVLGLIWLGLSTGIANGADPADCSGQFTEFWKSTAAPDVVREKFHSFKKITAEDNGRFISLSEDPGQFVFISESAILKELNDHIVRDKDLVTSLNNVYKEILYDLIDKSPVLRQHMKAKYSDFKSMKFIFDDNVVLNELQRVHREANLLFAEEFPKQIALFPHRQRTGYSNDPGKWFLAGFGGSHDEANLAARMARTEVSAHSVPVQNFGAVRDRLEDYAQLANRTRTELVDTIQGRAPELFELREGVEVLSLKAIEVLRKVQPAAATREAYITAVRADFKKYFDIHLSNKEILKLRTYVSSIDQFSPSLLIHRRVEMNLGQAQHGIVSVDFSGQNARNLQGTMIAVAKGRASPEEIAREARLQEKKVTAALNKNKMKFEKAAAPDNQGSTQFTGDDGLHFPDWELSSSEKYAILERASKHSPDVPPQNIRVTFIPAKYTDTKTVIPDKVRSQLIVAAEGIEKTLRRRLAGKYENILVGVDLEPTEAGDVVVNLYHTARTPKDSHVIEDTFKRIVGITTKAKMGKVVTRHSGPQSRLRDEFHPFLFASKDFTQTSVY